MIDFAHAADLPGKNLTGLNGETLGTIDAVYAQDLAGPLTFVSVQIAESDAPAFVPLADATLTENAVRVPYTKEVVQAATIPEPIGELKPADEGILYQHYGVSQNFSMAAGANSNQEGERTKAESPDQSDATEPTPDEDGLADWLTVENADEGSLSRVDTDRDGLADGSEDGPASPARGWDDGDRA